MDKMLQIYCCNNGKTFELMPGSTLLDAYKASGFTMPYGITSARVNNVAEGLNFRIYHNMDVEFLDLTSSSGMRTYVRSLSFVLCKAVEELFPEGQITIQHPVSKGLYCTLRIGEELTSEVVSRIRERMAEIIAEAIPFRRHEIKTEQALRLFREHGMNDKAMLLETSGSLYTNYYTLGATIDYYYGNLLPDTGFLSLFALEKFDKGVLLRYPDSSNPSRLAPMIEQNKMLDVFQEHNDWHEILGISTVGEMNKVCKKGYATDLINVSEALQEKKISRIADEIFRRKEVKIILVSGPSSSGKTTFSKRLSVQLLTNGIRPIAISLDDYFLNRELTPLDENGNYDFESLYALDLEFFNKQLQQLLAGEEVELPRFNFTTGKREFNGKKLRLEKNMMLILEGIHALNPELTLNIPDENKFKIYVSALTTIRLDNHNYIPTTDNRLLRRITRDYKYRNYSAEETISRWPSVRKGEDKWIFPYQENADAMFNSAMLFELAVIKEHALPILNRVPQAAPEYSEAYRLRRFLYYFVAVEDKDLPPTSLLREFLGGSSFNY